MNARSDGPLHVGVDVGGAAALRACSALAAAIMRALDGGGQAAARLGPMIRLEVAAEGVPALPWLAAQRRLPRLYWSDRAGERSVAGVGFADRLELQEGMAPAELIGRITARLQEAAAGIRYYGGFRFDPSTPVDAAWQGFGRGWFVLPRFELVQDAAGTRLACNAFPGRDSAARVLDDLRTLVASDAEDFPPLPSVLQRHDLPGRPAWLDSVEEVLGQLDGRRLGKLVLARQSTLELDGELDPLALLARLGRARGPCYHFYFSPDGQAAFVGASPEQLFHRRGREVSTEAVAGTRPRGHDPKDDLWLRDDLLACGKDGREHACVVRHLRRRLLPLARTLVQDDSPEVIRLAGVQHLRVGLSGELAPGVDDAALMARLHPTPAVAGDPPEVALARLAALEPFDRGWYAGPVGYVGAGESEFAVAIRSGLVQRRRLALFVGAGIVPGSVAGEEWQELDSKMSGLQAAWADE